ncbi:MAG: disulfide bond formation protein B [Paracoccaceae bacterium]
MARKIALVAGIGSIALLLGAFAFQYIGAMAPCKLCIWQRWPHGIAFALGLMAYYRPYRVLMALGALTVLFGAVVAFYHAGIELHWWQGPTTCTSQPIGGLSSEDLMNQIMTAPLVRCDEIPWSMFGLSMAAWNGIASLGLAALWLLALVRIKPE